MFNSGSPSGLSKAEATAIAQALVSDQVALSESQGKDGWISASTVDLNGRNVLVLVDVPITANELDIALQGISTTGTSSMYVRVFNASGVVVTTNYFGYINQLSASGLTSVAENPGDAALIAGSLLAPNFVSGSVNLRRQLGNTWRINSSIFDAANRRIETSHVTDDVGVGLTGVLFLLGTAGVNWDSGSARLRWRR